MGDTTVEASVRALHAPTKVVEGKYTDTGKMVCQATVVVTSVLLFGSASVLLTSMLRKKNK